MAIEKEEEEEEEKTSFVMSSFDEYLSPVFDDVVSLVFLFAFYE